MIRVKDIVGHGPRNPDAGHVTEVVEAIAGKAELTANFFQNFEGLAGQLEAQSKQGKGAATQALREECAWQAANIRRFVAAVRKRLQG